MTVCVRSTIADTTNIAYARTAKPQTHRQVILLTDYLNEFDRGGHILVSNGLRRFFAQGRNPPHELPVEESPDVIFLAETGEDRGTVVGRGGCTADVHIWSSRLRTGCVQGRDDEASRDEETDDAPRPAYLEG